MLDPYNLNAFLYFKEEIIWKKFGKTMSEEQKEKIRNSVKKNWELRKKVGD